VILFTLMRVKACVLTYRETAMLTRCLSSIEGVDEIEVFFNGSDGVAEKGFEFPGVNVISSAENLAFAAVVNRAIERAKGFDLLLFVTNDVTFLGAGVSALVDFLGEHEEVGVVGPWQRTGDNSEWHHRGGGFRFDRWSAEVLNEDSELPGDSPYREWIDGGAMLIRLTAVEEVGMMRPEYGFYWEDVDWGLQFNRAGWKVAVCSESIALHEKSPTVGRFGKWKKYMIARNRAVAARLNLEGREFDRVAKYLKKSARMRTFKKLFNEDSMVYSAGIRDGLAGWTKSMNQPVADHDPKWREVL
jgi:GT2 family glycosyltransferase